MIHTNSGKIIFTFILKPLFIALLLIGVFCLVYLRSSVMTLEYKLSDLERTKMDSLRDRKMLLAEKTSLLSLKKIASLTETQGFILPDRIKVIHVREQKGSLPYKASLERRQLTEP